MADLIDTLEADGSFNTLLSLLKLAEMTDRLRGAAPFTLFAPNDAAFQRVNIDEISKNRNDLASLLAYHMVEGIYTSQQISENEHLLTESGKSLTVTVEEGHQVIDNAKYVRTDISCGNGIIQVIDNVFLPRFSGWYCGGCC
jgi:uncharacterized surface protein with fasciclin (FAS1) repeats